MLITPTYRAKITILPVSSKNSNLFYLTGPRTFTGMPIFGGQTEGIKIIIILKSRTIKENIIKNMDLINIFFEGIQKVRTPLNAAVGILGGMVSISDNLKTGVITITVDNKNPLIARDIANQYVIELESLLKEKSFTEAKLNRIFIEEQLKNEEIKLKKYQQDMTEFQKETKMIEPTSQLKGAMEVYTNLITQKISLEVELKKAEATLSDYNPRITALKNQLDAINNQIKKIEEKTQSSVFPTLISVPEKLVEYDALLSKVKTSQAVYDTLSGMYEQARFEEIKDNLFVEVIDPAITPEGPNQPHKRRIVGIAAISSIFLSIFFVLFFDWYSKIRIEYKKKSSSNS